MPLSLPLLLLFFPSGQRMRGSSNPARLERSEKRLALVTETKARELLAAGGGSLAAQLSPASAVEPGGLLDQLLTLSGILLPPLVVGDRAPVAQEIGVPVLATTDASIARLEAANTAFHLVVGAREVFAVIALHQVRSQVGEHLQELGEAFPLQLGKGSIGQVSRHLLAPGIQAASHRRIAHYLSLLRPAAVQEVFGIQHPAMHAFDLRELARPGCSLGHDGLQARQLLPTARAHRPPFFESRCRLASTSSRSSAVCTVAKSSGAIPSRLSAQSTPAA